MNKKFRYIAYVLTGIALLTVIFFTKDEIKALASNKVYLNESDLTLELGRYRTLKVYGSKERVTYKSANNRAATVSSNGRVTAQGWGTTRVYAYVGNRTLSTKSNNCSNEQEKCYLSTMVILVNLLFGEQIIQLAGNPVTIR